MENEWDWSKVKGDRYDIPAREMYFILARWKEEGFKHILDLGCGKGRNIRLAVWTEQYFIAGVTRRNNSSINGIISFYVYSQKGQKKNGYG